MMILRVALLCILLPFSCLLVLTLSFLGCFLYSRRAHPSRPTTTTGDAVPMPSTSLVDSTTSSLLFESFLKSSPIKTVVDPYSRSHITVGNIVVAIKPYFSTPVNVVQSGDLFRLTKIYRRDHDQERHDSCVDQDHPIYTELICVGVVLSTYLDFEPRTNTVSLKLRSEVEEERLTEMGSLTRTFPLEVISLEKTLLRNMTG